MTEVYIYGIPLRIVYDFVDKILPEDFNNKVQILKKIVQELENKVSELEAQGLTVSAEVKTKIQDIKSKVYALPTVKYGEYVMAEHHNKIVDILKDIADVLEQIPVEKVVEKLVPECKAKLEVNSPLPNRAILTTTSKASYSVESPLSNRAVITPKTRVTVSVSVY